MIYYLPKIPNSDYVRRGESPSDSLAGQLKSLIILGVYYGKAYRKSFCRYRRKQWHWASYRSNVRRRGAKVIITGRSEEKVKEAADEIGAVGFADASRIEDTTKLAEYVGRSLAR